VSLPSIVNPSRRIDVCLVQMPFAAICRPSLALGLLTGYLDQAGLTSRVLYGNLEFAEQIGGDVYRLVESTPQNGLLGEWVFAGTAFPEFQPDHATYLEQSTGGLFSEDEGGLGLYRVLRYLHPNLDVQALLWEVRRQAGVFVETLLEQVLASGPKIVGCTSMFQQQCASLALLRRVKQEAPEVVTMLGGANCEGEMGRAVHREFAWVDYVASGEVDLFFGELCRSLVDGRAITGGALPAGIWGPGHRVPKTAGAPAPDVDTTAVEAAPSAEQRAMVADLDRVGVPDYDDFIEALERLPIGAYITPGLLAETSRGCWWGMKQHCTFCGLNGIGMAYRAKSPGRVLEELDGLTERYGIRRVQVVDNILDMKYLRTVLPGLAEREDRLVLFYEVKPNLKREHLEMFAAAGIRSIQPGIESMHSAILKLLNKGGSPVQNVQILKWGMELGISVGWNFLYGVPNEYDAWYGEMAEWVPLIAHLPPPMGMSRIRYDRFSPYHMRPEDFGIALRPDRRYSYIYPVSEPALAELVYFFEDRGERVRGDGDGVPTGQAGPGLQALQAAIRHWDTDYFPRLKKEGRPQLGAIDRGDAIELRDTRRVAVQEEIRLEGLDAQVYRLCEAAPTEEGLLRAASEAGGAAAPEAVREARERLQALKVVLSLEGRLLSLAVHEPIVPVLDDQPGGRIDHLALIKSRRDTSLARRCVRSSREMPLGELFHVEATV
jgi:ribosomal peptide maturation radical SAM protein 1